MAELPVARRIGAFIRRLPAGRAWAGLPAAALAALLAVAGFACLAEARRAGQPAALATQIAVVHEQADIALVVDMSSEIRPRISVLDAPMRVILDFPRLGFAAPRIPAAAAGPIADVRAGAFMRGEGRIVVELAAPLHVAEQRFVPLQGGGSRLVLRFAPIAAEAFRALARPISDDVVTGSIRAAAEERPDERPLVFIDPGHGGIDPGAVGPGGELEKTIVLDFALALRDRLEKGGKARVMLSRTADVFVPLAERVRMARQARARLFVSIHADALPAEDGEARGATIYTLAERATDARTQRLAEKENRADLVAGVEAAEDKDDVADILFDLARRESRAFSQQFARELVQSLPRATRLHRTPLKGAGFRVLRAPDVPSVLIELGFLTTPEEAALMQSADWRRATADATAEAIERFLAERVAPSNGSMQERAQGARP